MAGGLFSGWLHRVRRQGVAVILAICVWGLGVTLFGFSHLLWLGVLGLAVGGAADLVSAVFRSTMLQVVATVVAAAALPAFWHYRARQTS